MLRWREREQLKYLELSASVFFRIRISNVRIITFAQKMNRFGQLFLAIRMISKYYWTFLVVPSVEQTYSTKDIFLLSRCPFNMLNNAKNDFPHYHIFLRRSVCPTLFGTEMWLRIIKLISLSFMIIDESFIVQFVILRQCRPNYVTQEARKDISAPPSASQPYPRHSLKSIWFHIKKIIVINFPLCSTEKCYKQISVSIINPVV